MITNALSEWSRPKAARIAGFGYLQLNSFVMVFLSRHSYGYVLGLVFFGLCCLVLGYLVTRSADIPRILGLLIILAGVGYLVDSFAHVLLTDYSQYEPIFMMVVFLPAFVAEFSFTLWLIFKGGKIPEHP